MFSSLLNPSAFALILIFPLAIMAKIKDPDALVIDGVSYQSHANEVEATDIRSKKVLWSAVVYATIEPEHFNPRLERDVQWNIINALTKQGESLRVTNNRGEVFLLNLKTGQPVAEQAVVNEVAAMEGKTLLVIQAALVPFQSKKLDLALYRIRVVQQKDHFIVSFIDKSVPQDFQGRGNPGLRPGFEVTLDSGTLRILGSRLIR